MPLRDANPSRTPPIVAVGLIIANCLVFAWQLTQSSNLDALFRAHGLVPVLITEGIGLNPVRFLTSMFLHGGWIHLLGNMLFVWVFADNIEDRMGHLRFLAFYLLCGVAAGAAHVIASPHSAAPTIGASGAVSGVLGAYIILYPRAKVLTFIPLGFFLHLIEVPAFVFLGYWFLVQLLSGSLALVGGHGGGVAWWAHTGGFVAGAALLPFFDPGRRSTRHDAPSGPRKPRRDG